MHLALVRHPQSPALGIEGITVSAVRAGAVLSLRYAVAGAVGNILLPAIAAPARTNELWRHTCCEVFLRQPGANPYYEFNLSPSSAWAAYGFSSLRTGMHDAAIATPRIETHATDTLVALTATLDLSTLPGLSAADPWHANITAVIESGNGQQSLWALHHRPGPPDFHHPDCLIAELAATSGA